MRTFLLTGALALSIAGRAGAQPLPGGPPPDLPAAPAVESLRNDPRTFTMTGPQLWGTADYLLSWYQPLRTPPLIQTVPAAQASLTNPANATTVFPRGTGIDFGAFSGLRATVGANFDRFGVDVSGFVFDRQSEGGSAFSDGTPFAVARGYQSAGGGQPAVLYFSLPNQYSGGVTASATSRLYGFEGNVRHSWYTFLFDSTDVSLGFKYVDLSERLDISSTALFPDGSALNVRDAVRTRNTFYGATVGLRGRLGGDARGFGAELGTKSGVGGVAQRAELVGSNTVTSPTGMADTQSGGLYARGLNSGVFTRTRAAFLQDVDLRLTYNFNPWLQVSFGYSLLYLSDVARPGRAIDPVINDAAVRFIANGTPTTAQRPAFRWRDEGLTVHSLVFGLRVQY